MADLSKLKKRLGAPPPLEDTRANLQEPEVAPSSDSPSGIRKKGSDGRSARRTGRTVQFATRVTSEFDVKFRAVAQRDGLLFGELLEKALTAYENGR